MTALDAIDRKIIQATQDGLPLVAAPYRAVADEVGTSEEDVMSRMRNLMNGGGIRRIGVIPNHYALGYRYNGMTVWDVPDAKVSVLGTRIGQLDFVSHCYHRPRHMPLWRYNLFAMVHGTEKTAAEEKAAAIAAILGPDARDHRILYSTRILKKSGLRLGKDN